jgi:hypothetical protein
MTTWVPQSPASSSWQEVAANYVIEGIFNDAFPWRDDLPWLDEPTWASQSANNETWTVQGA